MCDMVSARSVENHGSGRLMPTHSLEAASALDRHRATTGAACRGMRPLGHRIKFRKLLQIGNGSNPHLFGISSGTNLKPECGCFD